MDKKKYLVIDVLSDEFEPTNYFVSRRELFKKYCGLFVEVGANDWAKVKNEEDAYELLMLELEGCSIEEFIERNGDEYPLEMWKDEVKDSIFYGICPNVKIYEVLEYGMFEVNKLKFFQKYKKGV